MQPFIPARLKKALSFLLPCGEGGRALERNLALSLNSPEERFHSLTSPALADLRGLTRGCLLAAALAPLFDDSFARASARRAQGGKCHPLEMPGVAQGGRLFGYDPAFRALMAHMAGSLPEKDAA